MVPKGWELSSIGKISDVSSGGTPSRNNEAYWNGNIPWVTTAEVQFKIIEDTVEKITEEGLANFFRQVISCRYNPYGYVWARENKRTSC
ncbi:type I restriction-modification system, specificity (S) subunit [Citrobacter koseri]|uniref:Type I restriction-modification system, specificity (S) subunit n=1 Tax=Citrobacter koseri TaxID=545 RepID=A0A2X2W0X2_CITKO|nr:type I restriction-modification system, specificity (S) subunit [Citrobacter koseri]